MKPANPARWRGNGGRCLSAPFYSTAITGVGTITALGVLAKRPELGTLNRRQAAARAGRAPTSA